LLTSFPGALRGRDAGSLGCFDRTISPRVEGTDRDGAGLDGGLESAVLFVRRGGAARDPGAGFFFCSSAEGRVATVSGGGDAGFPFRLGADGTA